MRRDIIAFVMVLILVSVLAALGVPQAPAPQPDLCPEALSRPALLLDESGEQLVRPLGPLPAGCRHVKRLGVYEVTQLVCDALDGGSR